MRIVLDSNIYVSSFATHGICQALFEHCLENHDVYISLEILSEVQRILTVKFKQPEDLTAQQLDFIKNHMILGDTPNLEAPVCRDPKDDHVLSLTRPTNSSYLVTGDKDLLVLKKFESASIVAPREFWEVIANS